MTSSLAWIYWNPPRYLFKIPYLDHPVTFYGIFFVSGFIIGYFILVWMFKQKLIKIAKDRPSPSTFEPNHLSYILTDRLTWFVILGTLVGARLGDVFFYDWPHFRDNLLEIFMVWKGGLASHGGVVGVFIGVYLYYRLVLRPFPEISFINLMDMMVVPSGLVACFIRLGNFFNQEILGPPTTLPWGIIFGHPVDSFTPYPRHPTQLYEALGYFIIFVAMMIIWKKKALTLKAGFISGLFFVTLFGFRFLIEFIKVPQSQMIDESFLSMGQYLSIPFVLFGFGLMAFGNKFQNRNTKVFKC